MDYQQIDQLQRNQPHCRLERTAETLLDTIALIKTLYRSVNPLQSHVEEVLESYPLDGGDYAIVSIILSRLIAVYKEIDSVQTELANTKDYKILVTDLSVKLKQSHPELSDLT